MEKLHIFDDDDDDDGTCHSSLTSFTKVYNNNTDLPYNLIKIIFRTELRRNFDAHIMCGGSTYLRT